MNEDLAQRIIERLRERNETLAVAESCTGGGVARRLTGISGASSVFVGSVTAYAPRIKSSLLNVDEALTRSDTIVSCATAQAMASGVVQTLSADWGIGTTGYAGPGGGDDRYDVGTVCIAVFSAVQGCAVSQAYHLDGSRHEVMEQAAQNALELLWAVLQK